MAFPLTLLYVAIALLSPGVFPPEISNLHIMQVLGGLTILACLFELPESGLGKQIATWMVVAFAFAGVLSVAFAGWLGGGVYFFIDSIPSLAPFFFVALSCRSLQRLKVLVFVLLGVSIFIISQGLSSQFSTHSPSAYVMCEACGSETPILRSRGLGVLNDPNDFGQLLVTVLPLLWLRWQKGRTASNFFFTLLPAAGLVFGMYLTHSRGGLLALAAVMLYGLKDKLSVAGSFLVATLGAAAAVALNITGGRGVAEDDGDRLMFWYTALQSFKAHPLFGIGAGSFSDINGGMTAHNSFALCLAEVGLFGYFFWIGLSVDAWGGLSARIRSVAAKKKKEKQQPLPWKSPAAPPGRLTPVLAQAQRMSAYVPAMAFSRSSDPPSLIAESLPKAASDLTAEPDAERRAYVARILKISLVGLLAAGSFISRTYATVFFIMLGMTTAFRLSGTSEIEPPTSKVLKKVAIVTAISIVGLSLAIRLGTRLNK